MLTSPCHHIVIFNVGKKCNYSVQGPAETYREITKLWCSGPGKDKKRPGRLKVVFTICQGIDQWPRLHGLLIQRRKLSLKFGRTMAGLLEMTQNFISWTLQEGQNNRDGWLGERRSRGTRVSLHMGGEGAGNGLGSHMRETECAKWELIFSQSLWGAVWNCMRHLYL